MTEYRQNVLRMYRRGMHAREIAEELGKSVIGINGMLKELRKSGDLVMAPGESEMRRSMGRMKALIRAGIFKREF